MALTLEMILRIVLAFACHGIGLLIITVPRYTLKKTVAIYTLLVSVGAIVILAELYFVDLMHLSPLYIMIFYAVMASAAFVVYSHCSVDDLSQKIMSYLAYLCYCTLVWAFSIIISLILVGKSLIAIAAFSTIVNLVVAILIGKKYNLNLQNDYLNKVHGSLSVIFAYAVFLFVLVQRTLTLNSLDSYDTLRFRHLQIVLVVILIAYLLILNIIQYSTAYASKQAELYRNESYKRQIEDIHAEKEKMDHFRHDMRHHNTLLASMIQQGKTKQALEYLKVYEEEIESLKAFRYCENETANDVLAVYAQKSHMQNVEFVSHVACWQDTLLQPVDVTVLFSNILENALLACEKDGCKECNINISAYRKKGKYIILCQNSCKHVTSFSYEGLPINLKRGGIGTKSIKKIAQKYGGDVEFKAEESVFTCQVVLSELAEKKD